jgi:hypothetical protein
MQPQAYFHLVGYTIAMFGFAAMYLAARPTLLAQGRDTHLKALIAVHFFRYFGLTALLPGVFNLAPAGFSQDFLFQVMLGDVLASIFALVAFMAVQLRWTYAIPTVWAFNIFGTLDYLNAAARVTPAITDANVLGPFGWIVITVFLPAWLVSHVAIFLVLAGRSETRTA